jgi:DNA-binding transcriptional MocR family regulator
MQGREQLQMPDLRREYTASRLCMDHGIRQLAQSWVRPGSGMHLDIELESNVGDETITNLCTGRSSC